MKIQLLMKGRDKTGKAQLYRTVTEAEFAQIAAFIIQCDGTRPWERKARP